MARGPSPIGNSLSGQANTSLVHGSQNSATSSPSQSFPTSQSLATDAFPSSIGGLSHTYKSLPINERRAGEKNIFVLGSFSKLEHSISNPEADMGASIFIRKLPKSTGPQALRSMLLFAKDLLDVDFVNPDIPEDQSFLSAVAHFKTVAGAYEARERLHGKANAANDANMIVEVFQDGHTSANNMRRNTIDPTALRHGSSSTSSVASSNGHVNRQSSRYNNTFQALDKMSPPNGSDSFPVPENNGHIQHLFSPKSPIGNSLVSSKSMINEDDGNDETGKLLANPVEYAKNGESTFSRRSTNPVSGFGKLSLSTSTSNSSTIASPPSTTFPTPRSVQSPHSSISPNGIQTPVPG
ncbi:hypothetical protein LTS18_014628, partial [Coniosporium uncinatum]